MASRRHRRGHKRSGHKRSGRNMLNKMVETSMTTVKSTSKKYICLRLSPDLKPLDPRLLVQVKRVFPSSNV